jgi:hypothetical protein
MDGVWTTETILLIEGRDRRRHVVDDELSHPRGLPVGAELLQVLVNGVDGLIHLVHAILETISTPFRQTMQ